MLLTCLYSLKQTHNPNWTAVLWDEPTGEALIELRYPWFLSTFKALKGNVPREERVMKSDALRPLVLHAFGGIYFDTDVECIRCATTGAAAGDDMSHLMWCGWRGHATAAAIHASLRYCLLKCLLTCPAQRPRFATQAA